MRKKRTLIDQPFSMLKGVKLVESTYELLCKKIAAITERTMIEFESNLGEKFMEDDRRNFNLFERQKLKKSVATDYNAVD